MRQQTGSGRGEGGKHSSDTVAPWDLWHRQQDARLRICNHSRHCTHGCITRWLPAPCWLYGTCCRRWKTLHDTNKAASGLIQSLTFSEGHPQYMGRLVWCVQLYLPWAYRTTHNRSKSGADKCGPV